MLTRRKFLHDTGLGVAGLAGMAGMTGGLSPSAALAAGDRTLEFQLLGRFLGTHIPMAAGLLEILPEMKGYTAPKIDRVDSMRLAVQLVVQGSSEFCEADPIVTMRAAAAGANLSVVGVNYLNTSLVFVVNGDRVKSLQDLENPENIVAVNSKGDFTHVMLIGPLVKRGVDIDKVNVVEVAGSSGRMRALLAGRVHAVPLHFDQAWRIAKEGNYPVMLEPWKEYSAWLSDLCVVRTDWLEKKANFRAAVDVQKAMITAFRRCNNDFDYFAAMYRKHGLYKKPEDATDEALKPVWDTLRTTAAAWPNDGGMKKSYFEELVPVYKAAGALQGDVDVDRLVDSRVVDEALSELG